MFSRIAILGPGLIGGSLARAITKQKLARELSLYEKDKAALKRLRKSRLTPHIFSNPAEAVQGADLVLLCTPINAMEAVMRQCLQNLKPGAIVTDVGSAKHAVNQTLEPLLKSKAHWIGGHPMAGTEHSGFAASRFDLFQGAVTLLTPTSKTNPKALAKTKAFWKALGCRVVAMDGKKHDLLVAQISHVPHIAAFAIAAQASKEALPLSAGCFRDTTRVATSSPKLWAHILLGNKPSVQRQLDGMLRHLAQIRQALQKNDLQTLEKTLEKGHEMRKTYNRLQASLQT